MAEFTVSLYEQYMRRQQEIAARLLECVDQIHDHVGEQDEDNPPLQH